MDMSLHYTMILLRNLVIVLPIVNVKNNLYSYGEAISQNTSEIVRFVQNCGRKE